MNETADHWLMFAREDLRMAELALTESIFNQVCFHSQQCVEKAIKGWLAKNGQVTPRTHRMADLLALLPSYLFGEMHESLIALDRFYIPTRYPDALPGVMPEAMPEQRDAQEAFDLAQSTLERIESVL